MRQKALLTFLILATALAFFSLTEKIPILNSQEEIFPEGAIPGPVPSPLQPAATISAEELERLEESGLDMTLDTAAPVEKKSVPLKYKLLAWQFLGIKILPLLAALLTMLILSVVFTKFRYRFLTEKPLIAEDKEQQEKPKEQSPKKTTSEKTLSNKEKVVKQSPKGRTKTKKKKTRGHSKL